MAATGGTPIILYHSTTAAAVPSNTNLAAGELGLNIADMKLYCENDSAVVTLLASADAAAGNFTTVDTTNLEVTNIKAKDGTASATITDATGAFTISTELSVDNININGNAIVSTDTDGNLSLTPNGAGNLVLDGLNWPQADGTADYVLKTNGSGQLSWTAQTGGGGGGGTSVTVTQVTATASQTDFSVTYTVGQLSVYLNGALLASADYTATNGTTVVLASGAAANDIFTAVAYSTVAGLDIESASPYMTAVGSGAGAVTTGVNNTFVGFEAGNDNTTGTNNTALGYQALDVNTTGGNNTALGSGASGSNTTGVSNVAVGLSALGTNQTGNSNVAIGGEALTTFNTNAGSCVAVGYRALYLNSTGIYNTAIGTSCMNSNTANNNTAVGNSAMYANTTGAQNTAMGAGALDTNTTGSENTAFGFNALTANTTASNNTAIGRDALAANTTGTNNTAVGYQALDANTTGLRNTALGVNALGAVTTGPDNTCVGYHAGVAITTGDGNTCMGYQAGDAITTGAYNVAIGRLCMDNSAGVTGGQNVAIGNGSTRAITSGINNVGIGQLAHLSLTTGSGNITIGATRADDNYAPAFNVTTENNRFVAGHDGITNAYVQVAWTVTSDARDKTNFAPVPHGLDFVNQLEPVAFQFRVSRDSDEAHGNKRYGFKAQDILALEGDDPVIIDNEVPEKLKYQGESLVPVLVNAIKELSAKCDSLQAEINTLKGQ